MTSEQEKYFVKFTAALMKLMLKMDEKLQDIRKLIAMQTELVARQRQQQVDRDLVRHERKARKTTQRRRRRLQ